MTSSCLKSSGNALELHRIARGSVHFVDERYYLFSRGTRVEKRDLATGATLLRFDTGSSRRWLQSQTLDRVLRRGVHHVRPFGERYLVWFDHSIGLFDADGSRIAASRLVGGRPLIATVVGGNALYGEYRNNSERSPVSLFVTDDGRNWEVAATLSDVRHIHSIIWDAFESRYLLFTGDEDAECRIYALDKSLRRCEIVAHGSQYFRYIAAVPLKDHVLLGTDTPLEQNYIVAWDRRTGRFETLAPVRNSVFWGAPSNIGPIFSTACEPSTVNCTRLASLYRIRDSLEIEELAAFRKDILPMKIGQYGQLRIAATSSSSAPALISTFSVEPHEHIYVVSQ